ncbi:MAG: flagellar biosynthetic protein FliQ [Candidatus Gastranaerophilales bacterium]|nr:flagellar biosynthetic protein FliQ [Candidatus Gastranaerophilales bacterium]
MEDMLLEHMGKGFILMLLISMPCVLMAAAIGLVVGILQAVTQVQEQTIAAAPKIFAVFLVLMIGGGTFTNMLVSFFRESSHVAFEVITKQDNFALMPGENLTPDDEMASASKNSSVKDLMKQAPKDATGEKRDAMQKVISTRGVSSPQPDLAETKYINRRR